MGHSIEIQLPPFSLGKSDAEFRIEKDGERLGTLYLSVGKISWRPSKGKHAHKMEWAKFAELMQDNSTASSGT